MHVSGPLEQLLYLRYTPGEAANNLQRVSIEPSRETVNNLQENITEPPENLQRRKKKMQTSHHHTLPHVVSLLWDKSHCATVLRKCVTPTCKICVAKT